MSSEAYQIFRFWRKMYEKRIVTEDGVYAEGQLPVDYGAASLEVNVTQRLILTDSVGHLLELRMDDMENVMDDTDNTGLGWTYTLPEGSVTTPPVGPSTITATWHVVTNPDLPADTVTRATLMYEHMVDEEGSVA